MLVLISVLYVSMKLVELINVVLNVILDEGIIASCGDLCGAVANKTGSKIAW